jgi:hypothetical protein
MNLDKLAVKQLFLSEIDLETSDVFDYYNTLNEAKIQLEELRVTYQQNGYPEIDIDFDSDRWVFFNHISGGHESMDFSFVDTLKFVKQIKVSLLKNILKCWVVYRLAIDEVAPVTARTHYIHVKEAILQTHAFKRDRINEYLSFLQNLELNEIPKRAKIASVLNFLSYYEEIDHNQIYAVKLFELVNSLKVQKKSRLIPSGKNMLIFSNILEQYFASASKISSDYIHFYPLLIWWKITTIIPLRPYEFCAIERDCFIYENDKCYLKLPRLKQSKRSKKGKGKQTIDRILIPVRIEKMILEYIEIIRDYGHETRKTLISRLVYERTLPVYSTAHRKRLNDSFLTPDLSLLIVRFYSVVINKSLGLSWTTLPPVGRKAKTPSINNMDVDLIRVRAIDTRHIAFINMLAQGWSKIEIARFGGHLVLETQNGYQNHQEYWIEEETQKILHKFRLVVKQTPSIGQGEQEVQSSTSFFSMRWNEAAFKKNFILRPPTTTYKKELDLGYCTDLFQRCRTHCLHCDYWRISQEEYEERQEEVQSFIRQSDTHIFELFAFLKNLHRFVFSGELNPEIAERIISTQKEINDEVYKRAAFYRNLNESGLLR